MLQLKQKDEKIKFLEQINKDKFDFQLVRDLQSKINEKNKLIQKMKKETKKPVNLYSNRKRNMTMSGMIMGQKRRDSQNQLMQLRQSISKGASRKSSINLNNDSNNKRNSLFLDLKLDDEEKEHEEDDTETYEEPDIRERRESEVSSLNCIFNQGLIKISKKQSKPFQNSIRT